MTMGNAGSKRSIALRLALVSAMATSACSRGAVDREAEAARTRLMESEGGQMVLEAIEAHGGLEAWYSAPTSAYAWEYSNLGSNTRFESYLVADNRSRRVYHDLRTFGTPESVEPVDARFAWDGEEAWISPAERQSPNPRFWALTGFYFESIPFVMADPGIRFLVLPPEDLNGVPHDRIMAYYDAGVGDSPGDTYTLYLNPESRMVDAVLYTVTFGRAYEPGPGDPEPTSSGTLFYYQDYTTVDGLTVPTRFRGFAYRDGVQGDLRNEAWASEISFRQPFDESRLTMPGDARVETYAVE
jgi:hypothetical protein